MFIKKNIKEKIKYVGYMFYIVGIFVFNFSCNKQENERLNNNQVEAKNLDAGNERNVILAEHNAAGLSWLQKIGDHVKKALKINNKKNPNSGPGYEDRDVIDNFNEKIDQVDHEKEIIRDCVKRDFTELKSSPANIDKFSSGYKPIVTQYNYGYDRTKETIREDREFKQWLEKIDPKDIFRIRTQSILDELQLSAHASKHHISHALLIQRRLILKLLLGFINSQSQSNSRFHQNVLEDFIKHLEQYLDILTCTAKADEYRLFLHSRQNPSHDLQKVMDNNLGLDKNYTHNMLPYFFGGKIKQRLDVGKNLHTTRVKKRVDKLLEQIDHQSRIINFKVQGVKTHYDEAINKKNEIEGRRKKDDQIQNRFNNKWDRVAEEDFKKLQRAVQNIVNKTKINVSILKKHYNNGAHNNNNIQLRGRLSKDDYIKKLEEASQYMNKSAKKEIQQTKKEIKEMFTNKEEQEKAMKKFHKNVNEKIRNGLINPEMTKIEDEIQKVNDINLTYDLGHSHDLEDLEDKKYYSENPQNPIKDNLYNNNDNEEEELEPDTNSNIDNYQSDDSMDDSLDY